MQTSLKKATDAEEAKMKEKAQPVKTPPMITDGRENGDKASMSRLRRATSSDGPRVEVDSRTEDSKSVRMTVVSWGDGSSERVTQMKVGEVAKRITKQMA